MPPPEELNPISVCQPRNANVVVRRDQKPDKSAGGVLLPDNHFNKQQVGTVLAVGPEVTDIKAGHRVILAPYAGTEMTHGRKPEEFVILHEKEVLGFIPDQAK